MSYIGMIRVYICNASKQTNSFSCVTYGIGINFDLCYIYIRIIIELLLLMRYASGYYNLWDMSHYCFCVVMRVTILNMFPHLFMRRLRVWNPVLFSASVRNAAAHAFRGPDGSTTSFIVPPETHTTFAKAKEKYELFPSALWFHLCQRRNYPFFQITKITCQAHYIHEHWQWLWY